MGEQGKINYPAPFETGLSLGGAMVFSFFLTSRYSFTVRLTNSVSFKR